METPQRSRAPVPQTEWRLASSSRSKTRPNRVLDRIRSPYNSRRDIRSQECSRAATFRSTDNLPPSRCESRGSLKLTPLAGGLDPTPELLAVARENAAIAQMDDITWKEGDVENLPFRDSEFDVVLSQFARIFAPRPEVALKEMLRVLKPGGRIAFNTWPPELFIGRMFAITASYLPPPDPKPAPPAQWGDPNVVLQRLGSAVRDVTFDRGTQVTPALSTQHYRHLLEQTRWPNVRFMQALKDDPARLAQVRRDYDELASRYFDGHVVRQDFLMTRATKV